MADDELHQLLERCEASLDLNVHLSLSRVCVVATMDRRPAGRGNSFAMAGGVAPSIDATRSA